MDIKVFTLYAQLQGKRLYYGTTFLPVINTSNIKDGTRGFFIVLDTDRGFSIIDVINPNLP